MTSNTAIPGWKDDILLTPGPLTTSRTVKEAMLRDLGSRDAAFIDAVRDIRTRLLAVAGQKKGAYEAVILQGSGTFGVEAVLGSSIPRDGKVLIVVNGAYGHRMVKICDMLGIANEALVFAENEPIDVARVATALSSAEGLTHLAVVHCETTTGIMNPIAAIGALAKEHGLRYFVDAMSSFGAVPVDFDECHIDYLVSSANKCIEGVPGFSFAIIKADALAACEGQARSLSFDIHAQWKGLEANGQFRFTPPTHALLAYRQALLELEEEGGVAGRAARYTANYETLLKGMAALGFEAYLPAEQQGYIITSFRYPDHPNFDFEAFYDALNARGYVIYPGKVSDADCFRIGNIGRIFESDIENLLGAIGRVLEQMDIEI